MRGSIFPLASLLLIMACDTDQIDAPDAQDSNPVLAEWTGPYGGVPAFDLIRVSDFAPALEAAMEAQLSEIDAIAANLDASTFENTIEALERSGRPFQRAETLFDIWSSSLSDEAYQVVEREMAPKRAAFKDRIVQNRPLFDRIEQVYSGSGYATLTPEQQRLAWLYYTNFVRAGARLDRLSKARLSEINGRLAALFTSFSQNVLADESELSLIIEIEQDLAGLPGGFVSSASAAADAAGHSGHWLVANTRSSVEPFLTTSDRRPLREQMWRLFVNRGDNGGERDNNAIITEILSLRAERAVLLGFATHADWRLEPAMAKTPARAMELMQHVWGPAKQAVAGEVRDMTSLAAADGLDHIEPWDYLYYAEKVRKDRYDLDENEVKPYMQLEKLREGMFWVAGELFGLDFSPVTDVPVFHADVRVWQVTNRTDGNPVGLWYFDPYARAGKSSGAWMNAYRRQEKFDGAVTTIVSNNSNFVKGQPGEPILISWSDATTLFHEFGHALHGLLSDVNYPSLSGTSVARDYVEFPSQLLEHWLSTPEVLSRFALHNESGEPIPGELVDKIRRASTFRQGYDTVEYLASALIDMRLHTSDQKTIDPDAFERETLAELGMPSEIVMRHRTPQFSHIFSSDSYSAGYYSYLWADVLTADAWEAFVEAGGPYDRATIDKLHEYILSAGNTVDPAEAYRSFRGRDPEVDALMRKRGLLE